MTNMLKNNSNPSGYDTRYCGSYCNIDSNIIKQEYNLVENEIKKKTENTNQLDNISLLKIEYIIGIIKRKLNILHRITKSKRIADSVIIEREIEKRLILSMIDMLAILEIADKDRNMTTQQKVVLLSEINKSAKLTIDEKITIIEKIIAINIVKDNPSKKHLSNKLILLFIVKKSGFSIDETSSKGYKPVMQSIEEFNISIENNSSDQISEKLQNNNLISESSQLKKEYDIGDKPPKNFINISTQNFDKSTFIDEGLQQNYSKTKPTNSIIGDSFRQRTADNKPIVEKANTYEKIPTITRTFVHSKRHFKFGAGVAAKNNTLSLLLPSGYVLDDNNTAYQPNSYYISKKVKSNNSSANSPLYIIFKKNIKSVDYTLFDFFNSNIIECKTENLKYRQTVISKSPAVLKHKPGENIYTASVFLKKINCVYDIKFKFKKTIANKTSTVNRILASIKFEGM